MHANYKTSGQEVKPALKPDSFNQIQIISEHLKLLQSALFITAGWKKNNSISAFKKMIKAAVISEEG